MRALVEARFLQLLTCRAAKQRADWQRLPPHSKYGPESQVSWAVLDGSEGSDGSFFLLFLAWMPLEVTLAAA